MHTLIKTSVDQNFFIERSIPSTLTILHCFICICIFIYLIVVASIFINLKFIKSNLVMCTVPKM